MKIIDNFIADEYANFLEEQLLGNDFAWYINHKINNEYGWIDDGKTIDASQFVHTFIMDNTPWSQKLNLVQPLVYQLMARENVNTRDVMWIKTNLTFKDISGKHHPAHIDFLDEPSFTTAIYYVNDSDGDTLFFEKDGSSIKEVAAVTPKKNRLVYFDGNTLHAGTAPAEQAFRCVINMNFRT